MRFSIKYLLWSVTIFCAGLAIGRWTIEREFDEWKAKLGIYGYPSAESVRKVWVDRKAEVIWEFHPQQGVVDRRILDPEK